jgi:hypothetical protein
VACCWSGDISSCRAEVCHRLDAFLRDALCCQRFHPCGLPHHQVFDICLISSLQSYTRVAVPAVPTTISPEVVCSSVSELVRMAAAALISLYVYLNFKQGPQDLAAGESPQPVSIIFFCDRQAGS